MGRAKDPTQTRAQILAATARVIAGGGVAALTLDEVARVAQVSKGGLLHHYPTKHALLSGMLAQKASAFEVLLQESTEREPVGTPGRWARGYIHATFAGNETLGLTGTMVTALLAEPALLAEFNQISCYLPPDDDGLPAGRLTLIRMACDGLWMNELTDAPLDPAIRAALYAELMELTR